MGIGTFINLIVGIIKGKPGSGDEYGKSDAHEVLSAAAPVSPPTDVSSTPLCDPPAPAPEPPAAETRRILTLDDFGPYSGPLEKLPRSRKEVYQIYGRPTEGYDYGTDPSLLKKKVVMHVEEKLPGTWNGGKPRLYMLKAMGPYIREALERCDELDVLKYIDRMGCYNFRHAQFNPKLPLSYHSWGAAVDINSDDNLPRYLKSGPIPAPFSAQWLKRWPNGVPYELVLAFMSVGFAWGGCWNVLGWLETVKKHGVGYDTALVDKSWKTVTYSDPMHFELIDRT